MIDFHFGVERSLGIYDHNRTQCAQTETACFDDVYLVLKTVALDLFLELFDGELISMKNILGLVCGEPELLAHTWVRV